ncbi:OmpA family protein [Sulfurimonas sp. MAG313]|nr:OmpA family protein [Sulfurimonas sp. MAG313]MDF1881520.1 OmpA family protein [Sulfurimonas sp. MAG313]
MIRICISLCLLALSLLSNVNPLVVFNTQTFINQNKVIFLPDEQVIKGQIHDSNVYKLSKDEIIWVLIKPYEYLYIRGTNDKAKSIKAELSLDAKVFESKALEISNKIYKLYNNHASLLAVKLRSQEEMKISLLTTLNNSILNQLSSTKVALDGKATYVYSRDRKSKELYYQLHKEQNLSFNLQGPGTLCLSMRDTMQETSLTAYRKRISVSINKTNEHVLESLNGVSYDRIHAEVDIPVSSSFSHYISLKEGDNNISIQNFSEILLRAEFFHKNVLNPMNDTNLSFTVADDLSSINQPKWLNTNIDDGLKRMAFIHTQQDKIIDVIQKKGLEGSANKSTQMKEIYPTHIPIGTSILNAYYAKKSLYIKDEVSSVSSMINDKNILLYLNKLRKGSFYEVPNDSVENLSTKHVVILEKLYFKTRQYKLDRALRREIKKILHTLKSYEEIQLYGFTDTRGNIKSNEKLSLKRCENVKEELIALGVASEKIIISAYGESKNAVNTEDSVKEISNRRVEIRVVQNVSANKNLLYSFEKPLQRDTKVSLTLFSPNHEDLALYMHIDGEAKLISYKSDLSAKEFSFSPGTYAFNLANEHAHIDTKKALNTLKNSVGLSFIKQTGTISLILKKGTRELKFTRVKGSPTFNISLSQQVNAPYQDTPYSLAHDYNGSYLRFSSSLTEGLPLNKSFDAWYQHTHPLRLFMRSSIQEAHKNLNSRQIPTSKDLDYAQELMESNERVSALEIARHALILSEEKTVQKRAYNILLKLSTTTKQALMWHSVYFSKMPSSDNLKKVSKLLRDNGQYNLALTAQLLLDKDLSYIQASSNLALILNKTLLRQTLLGLSDFDINGSISSDEKGSLDSVVEEKLTLLTHNNYKYNRRVDSTSVRQAAGLVKIHSKNTKKISLFYRATWQQPLKLQVQGPIQLDLDIRVLSSIKRYEWLRLEHNNKIYHYPLMKVNPSAFLEIVPGQSPVGVNNHLRLDLGEGNHTLLLHGYDAPLAHKVYSRKIEISTVKKLEEQVLLTSDFNASKWTEKRAEPSLVYASALLWNYTYSIYQHRYHAQAQAFLLQGETSDSQVQSILRALRLYSSFSLYPSLHTQAGFLDIKVPTWYPRSLLQKSRSPLLKGLNTYSFILTGSDYKLIHTQGNQTLRVDVQQIYPNFLSSKALAFAVSIDSEPEEVVQFFPNKEKWSKNFILTSGEHSFKIRLLKPLSTHYLGVNIFEDSKKLDVDVSTRYYISRKNAPIILHEKGPKLLRMDYKFEDGSLESSYLYLNENKQYHEEVYPTKGEKQSLISMSELIFDPLQKAFETLKPIVYSSVLLTDKDKNISQLSKQSLEKEIFESFDASCSLEFAVKSVELSSDDNPNSVAKKVIEIGQYCRKRMADELYIRQHYYSRLYENPLLALTHKVYAKLPLEDVWFRAEANFYMQESGFVFKNLNLKSEVFIKEKLWPQWRHQYGGSLFKNFLDYDNIRSNPLDPLVYSRYKRDHQYGGTLLYDIYYRMFEDTELVLESKVISNESLAIVDNIRVKPMLRHLAYPFYMSLYYDSRRYFEDRNRPQSYSINRLGAKLRYDDFFNMNRLQLQAGMIYKIESSDMQFSMQFIWHFSDNKRYYNFMPDENIFNNLRLRLDDEK